MAGRYAAPPVPNKRVEVPVDQKEKPRPPTPPSVIVDQGRGRSYTRIGFLGEGGFARVYEVQDRNGDRKAVKVVSKESIRTKKNKTKLWAEIKLHQMLSHPHIVGFEDCFEDEENVYMILELCPNGSLMDLLRRRRRFTEPEARYFLVQVISASLYMHQTNVIHRDLKLGNLFLDSNMDVKVGDLGLAALIEKPGDRKKLAGPYLLIEQQLTASHRTICGTPNYIAPEVLFDTVNGHSFEVDVWSVGVILYTLLIGKPPFQTKDVKAIYKRIRENRYEFPPDKEISDTAKDLIMCILNPNPHKRPTLHVILAHSFFSTGTFPSHIPFTASDSAPTFRHVTASDSRRNFQNLCQKAKIGVSLPIRTDNERKRIALGPSILQQERDFQNAVQPNSPISALLNSARQPLVQSSSQIKEPSLLRKLSAAGAQATLSPARRRIGKENAGVGPPVGVRKALDRLGEEDEEEEEENEELEERGYDAAVREREVAAQKARILSEMATERPQVNAKMLSPRKNPLGAATSLPPRIAAGLTGSKHDVVDGLVKKEHLSSVFDVFAQNIAHALAMAQTDNGFQSPDIPADPVPPHVFVISWLDYCTKYGMGFAMNDGTVCVHFNDSSSIALSPDKTYFDYIQPTAASQGDSVHSVRRNYPMADHPRDLTNKVYLLKHFEHYILQRLVGNQEFCFEDLPLKKNMVFVAKYLRMKHVILFRLSNDLLQFNFYDHTKIIFSHDGLVVSVIDKHYIFRTWSLEALLRPVEEDAASKEQRRMDGVQYKVQYCNDILAKIRKDSILKAKTSEPPLTRARAQERERALARPIR